ncbi:MAG TPA: hypothetical protein VF933_19650, partial [Streptosporangiaceae bacterium]
LRRRYPEQKITPLRSAEPQAPEEPEPGWLATLAGQRKQFAAKLEERQNVRVPAEDPHYQDQGEAWPLWKTQKEAILQPPPAPIPPAREMERLAGHEAGD